MNLRVNLWTLQSRITVLFQKGIVTGGKEGHILSVSHVKLNTESI